MLVGPGCKLSFGGTYLAAGFLSSANHCEPLGWVKGCDNVALLVFQVLASFSEEGRAREGKKMKEKGFNGCWLKAHYC